MRRLLLILGTVGFAGVTALAACSSDDSSGTQTGSDASTDTGTGTDSGGKTDSGGPKDSGTDSSTCQTCSSFLQIGPSGTPCPESAPLEDAFFACLCGGQDGGVGCFADCTATCTSFANPDDTCVACFSSTCSAETAACAADGSDAGTTTSDAGDGGDGG